MAKNEQNKVTKDTRKIAQVSSKSLVPPEEPDEATEQDVDFAKEEADLEKQMKALKEKRASLNRRKKVAVGGKKLGRMRKYATETVDWANSSADKLVVSVKRANDAVAKLTEYESKLGLAEKNRVGEKLADGLATLTEAAEVIDGANEGK